MRTAVFRSKQTPGRTITRSRADGPLRGIERGTSNIRTPIFVFTMAEVIDLSASRISALLRRELGSVLKRSDHIPELLLTGPLPSLGSVRRSSECKRLDSNYFVWLRFHLFRWFAFRIRNRNRRLRRISVAVALNARSPPMQMGAARTPLPPDSTSQCMCFSAELH